MEKWNLLRSGGLLVIVSIYLILPRLISAHESWTHEYKLDSGFQVRFDADDPDFLTMEMSAPTTGYVALGFSPMSPDGLMWGADIVMGWIDSEGVPFLKDYHGVGKVDPVLDNQQDYFLIAAAERNNETIIRFYRRWDTCDDLHDIRLGNGTTNIIWAFHTDDPSPDAATGTSFGYHGSETRGFIMTYMHSRMPLPFPDGSDGFNKLPSHTKAWDLTLENVDVDGVIANSLVVCKLFQFPVTYNRQYHLIGYRPLITEENEKNVYDISVYQCRFSPDFEDMKIGDQSEETCFDSATYCKAIIISWAMGSEGEMLPTHMGMPFPDAMNQQNDKMFMLKVHYENLAGKQFLDSSGIRIYFTDELRLYHGGVIRIGHQDSPFLAIPPSQEQFRINGFCSSECTRNGIPDAGINIVSVMLRSHETGRKMTIRHIRNGKELYPIVEDGNYTHNYQQHRYMRNEVKIFPGDELLLECSFDTLEHNKFIYGGNSLQEETCQALLYYYPKVNLTICESKPEFQSFFAGFGIRHVIGEGLMRIDHHPQQEWAPQFLLEQWPRPKGSEEPFDSVFITQPEALFNVSVGKKMYRTNWAAKHSARSLENAWKKGKHYLYCEGPFPLMKKHIVHIPRFHEYKKPPNSVCRTKMHKNAGEIQVRGEMLSVVAMTVFIKIVFDTCCFLC